jgi:hypothetical protein
MKKNILIVGLLAVAAFVGVMFLGRSTDRAMSSPTEVTVKSALSAPETLYDFGVVLMKNGKVSRRFKITNPTDKDLTAEYLSTSCMCTTAYIVDDKSRSGPFGMEGMSSSGKAKILFRPQESREIEVVFDPNAHGPAGVGPLQRFVTLTDATGGKLRLEIKGLVKP